MASSLNIRRHSVKNLKLSDLTKASLQNNIDAVTSLLRNGCEVNVVDGEWTPLLAAADKGHYHVVKLLLSSRSNVNWVNKKGQSALLFASRKGYTEIVKLLLQHKANVDQTQHVDGCTSIIIAASKGNKDVVDLLSKAGANINHKNNEGVTALMIASKRGYVDTVQVLLDNRVDVNLFDENGWNALMYASYQGHLNIVSLLFKNQTNINHVNIHKQSALLIAAQKGCHDIVKFLINNNSDVNHVDKDGITALMLGSYAGDIALTELLLQNNAQVDQTTDQGWSALLLAAQNGHTDIVKLLLKSRADVNLSNKKGNTALVLAAQNAHTDTVKVLLSNGADPNHTNLNGWSVLMVASQNSPDVTIKTLELLLKYNANISYSCSNGWNAILIAACHGYPDTVRFLQQYVKDDVYNARVSSLLLALNHGTHTVMNLLNSFKSGMNELNTNNAVAAEINAIATQLPGSLPSSEPENPAAVLSSSAVASNCDNSSLKKMAVFESNLAISESSYMDTSDMDIFPALLDPCLVGAAQGAPVSDSIMATSEASAVATKQATLPATNAPGAVATNKTSLTATCEPGAVATNQASLIDLCEPGTVATTQRKFPSLFSIIELIINCFLTLLKNQPDTIANEKINHNEVNDIVNKFIIGKIKTNLLMESIFSQLNADPRHLKLSDQKLSFDQTLSLETDTPLQIIDQNNGKPPSMVVYNVTNNMTLNVNKLGSFILNENTGNSSVVNQVRQSVVLNVQNATNVVSDNSCINYNCGPPNASDSD
ncbi:ankyrin repeat domain-containing protein 50-like [Physella acuta]|uniref:ankyrin repeat domain-containing protein 50-like n=1 Tax=Physella acuta TaxID=109671 RepID=UPI0027DAE89B|nr:ankyrin repeat domain-containing protein 50-like [Physella acuta]XP_059139661.1 ankyrin repeat domain-containing protein 50-like [Physella acuta]